jgi:hypothetical protein
MSILGRDIRGFHADEIATASTTIRSSWQKGCFGSLKEIAPMIYESNKKKSGEICNFLDVWQVNSRETRLSQ